MATGWIIAIIMLLWVTRRKSQSKCHDDLCSQIRVDLITEITRRLAIYYMGRGTCFPVRSIGTN